MWATVGCFFQYFGVFLGLELPCAVLDQVLVSLNINICKNRLWKWITGDESNSHFSRHMVHVFVKLLIFSSLVLAL